MNPIELVKGDLTPEEWEATSQSWTEPIQEVADQCPFSRYRLFLVHGRTKQFDFSMLPHGSYGYYAANGRVAIRLTREGKEIERILAEEWDALPDVDAVCLASLILKFYDAGIKASHDVLRDGHELEMYGGALNLEKDFELDSKEMAKALPDMEPTQSTLKGSRLIVRALTLCGWMHEKKNLGVGSITIASDGMVSFGDRVVLSKRIFRRTPGLRY